MTPQRPEPLGAHLVPLVPQRTNIRVCERGEDREVWRGVGNAGGGLWSGVSGADGMSRAVGGISWAGGKAEEGREGGEKEKGKGRERKGREGGTYDGTPTTRVLGAQAIATVLDAPACAEELVEARGGIVPLWDGSGSGGHAVGADSARDADYMVSVRTTRCLAAVMDR